MDAGEFGEIPDFVATRLRAAREHSGLSVRALARLVAVSPSFISQVENGKANPSVGTLLAIVSVLGITLDELFKGAEQRGADEAQVVAARDGAPGRRARQTRDAERGKPPIPDLVLREANRRVVDLAGGVRWERLTPDTDRDVTFLYVTYEVGGSSCPPDTLMQHSGRECGLVVSGQLGAQVGLETYVLDPGDSIVTDCSIPHRFWTVGDEPARVVWTIINAPD
jgi:transcriptional regulator with XRE-family HTH domain